MELWMVLTEPHSRRPQTRRYAVASEAEAVEQAAGWLMQGARVDRTVLVEGRRGRSIAAPAWNRYLELKAERRAEQALNPPPALSLYDMDRAYYAAKER